MLKPRGAEEDGDVVETFALGIAPDGLAKSCLGSVGVGKSDKGRFVEVDILGLSTGTGEGDNEGSFSFDADASSSVSVSELLLESSSPRRFASKTSS